MDRFGALAEAGCQHVIFSVRGVADTSKLERLGAEVFPQLRCGWLAQAQSSGIARRSPTGPCASGNASVPAATHHSIRS